MMAVGKFLPRSNQRGVLGGKVATLSSDCIMNLPRLKNILTPLTDVPLYPKLITM